MSIALPETSYVVRHGLGDVSRLMPEWWNSLTAADLGGEAARVRARVIPATVESDGTVVVGFKVATVTVINRCTLSRQGNHTLVTVRGEAGGFGAGLAVRQALSPEGRRTSAEMEDILRSSLEAYIAAELAGPAGGVGL